MAINNTYNTKTARSVFFFGWNPSTKIVYLKCMNWDRRSRREPTHRISFDKSQEIFGLFIFHLKNHVESRREHCNLVMFSRPWLRLVWVCVCVCDIADLFICGWLFLCNDANIRAFLPPLGIPRVCVTVCHLHYTEHLFPRN